MSDFESIKNNPEAKRCWTRVVVLVDHIDKLKDHFPSPRPTHVDDLITLFEHRVAREVQKLKNIKQ